MTASDHFHSIKRTGFKLTIAFDESDPVTIASVHVRPFGSETPGDRILDQTIGDEIMKAAENFATATGQPPREARIGWVKAVKAAGQTRRGEVLTLGILVSDEDDMVELFTTDLPDGFGKLVDHRDLIQGMHRFMLEQGQGLLEDPHMVFMLCSDDGEPEVFVQRSGAWSIYDHHLLLRFMIVRAAATGAFALVTGAIGRDKASGEDLYMIGCELEGKQHHAILPVGPGEVVGEIESTVVERHLPFQWDIIRDVPGVWNDLPGGRDYARHLLEDCTEPFESVLRIKHLSELPLHLQVLGSSGRISWPTLRPAKEVTH